MRAASCPVNSPSWGARIYLISIEFGDLTGVSIRDQSGCFMLAMYQLAPNNMIDMSRVIAAIRPCTHEQINHNLFEQIQTELLLTNPKFEQIQGSRFRFKPRPKLLT